MQGFFYSNETKHKNCFNPLSLQASRFSDLPKVSKHLFTVKPTLIQKRYADLDDFRQQIIESKAGLHHQPFTSNKKNAAVYKAFFLGFSALFFILGVTAMAIPSALGCGMFFSSCTLLKGIIVSICTFFSLTALTVGLRIKPEKEAVAQSMRRTMAHMATIYARKKIRIGATGFSILFGPEKQKMLALRQMYHEMSDKINDKKDETLHMVQRIATAETLDAQEKEDLLNQALEEFNDKLHTLTNNFRHAATN